MVRRAADRKIIMAVDFGTTYSGLAWAQTRQVLLSFSAGRTWEADQQQPKVHTTIIQWPDATSGGLEGATSDKVPTEIAYNGSDFKWGFQIAEYDQRHQWFKLELDRSHIRSVSSLARDFPDPHAAPPGYSTSPEKLVTDYLTALRKHAEQMLKDKVPPTALKSSTIEYVITVPAVWSDAAQAKTRLCAEKAGMGKGSALHIISEPEAAAMYALDIMDPHDIKIGDTFVLCDAGGGTVDLISYTVLALKPRLQITEAAPGSGSLCGSSFLNRIFHKFLKDKLSEHVDWEDDVADEALQRFESSVKRSFAGIDSEEYLIPVYGLGNDALRGVRRNKFTLKGSEVRTIFEPVVQEVINLINGQIEATKRPIKTVLLVGGFGQNVYLRNRIREVVWSRGIKVMQSPNSWTAVVRGALMKGLASGNSTYASVRVSGRSARRHYGTLVNVGYDPYLHELHSRFWSDFDGAYRALVIQWLIKKGDLVEEAKPQRLSFREIYADVRGPPSEVEHTILVCSDPDDIGAPVHEDPSRVQDLSTLKADLSGLPRASFRKTRGADQRLYYRIDYEIEVTYYSAYTKYELIYDDVNYGAVTAEYV